MLSNLLCFFTVFSFNFYSWNPLRKEFLIRNTCLCAAYLMCLHTDVCDKHYAYLMTSVHITFLVNALCILSVHGTYSAFPEIVRKKVLKVFSCHWDRTFWQRKNWWKVHCFTALGLGIFSSWWTMSTLSAWP